jgi:hypothetical protein
MPVAEEASTQLVVEEASPSPGAVVASTLPEVAAA